MLVFGGRVLGEVTGVSQGHDGGTCMMELMPLEKKKRQGLSSLSEEAARKHSRANQEEDWQELNLRAP